MHLKSSLLFYSFLFFTLIVGNLQAKEKLIIIDAVSTSKQTFVIHRGAQDSISVGAESLFSNENISVLAKAIEVTRDYSLWRIKEPKAIFPFEQNEAVTFNRERTNIWNELPNIQKRVARAKREEEVFQQLYGTGNTFQLRTSLSNTFYESTTDTDSQRSPERDGIHLEALYHKRMFEHFELGAGLRYDQENAVITDPDLTLPTTRIMGLLELTYHFSSFDGQANNFYIAGAVGIGRSQTEVNESVSTGLATLLPSVRFGYLVRRAQGLDFTFEAAAEAISAQESFLDTKEQTTNLVNAKLSLGVRF